LFELCLQGPGVSGWISETQELSYCYFNHGYGLQYCWMTTIPYGLVSYGNPTSIVDLTYC